MEGLKQLEAWFAKCPGALVAFSGGVDSSLVAFLAHHFLGRSRAMAVISASPSLKLSELDGAKVFAGQHNLALRVVTTEELLNPNYFQNPSNRCYYCKHTLYDELAGLLVEFPDRWVLNGTNTDDLGDYRPGLEAAAEFEVRSPLVDCGIDKSGVRALAAHFNLECWDKPASPCLSSRVPYGEQITAEKLRQIEFAEARVAEAGFPVNRVRHFGTVAKVEVPADRVDELAQLRGKLELQLMELGFERVELDAEGFVSGKLNRAL